MTHAPAPSPEVADVIPPARVRYRSPLLAAAVMAISSAVVAWGGIAAGVYNDRATADQNIYHLKVIQQFSREFPRPNLSDYYSATGPGFHLAIALVDRFVSQDVDVLRAFGATFTVALLAVLGWAAGSGVRWPRAVVLCLPMLASLYVFVSGVWLLPDNLAWLCVLLVILTAWDEWPGVANLVLAAVALAAAVFVRQINLWPLGVFVAGMVCADTRGESDVDDEHALTPALPPRWWRPAGLALLTGVPALVILAWFHRMWHGLTPPAFQTVPLNGPLPPGHSSWQHEGPNFAVPAMVLAVLAATGAFFAGFLWPAVRKIFRERRGWLLVVLVGMLIGAALALVPPTGFNQEAGRYSGLWNVSARFPVVAHRSLFIAGMSAAGGAVVALFFLALGRRDRWLWLATWACFAAGQTANAKAWHKYYEPFCLMMLALAASRVIARQSETPRWAYVGPVLLAVLLAAVTLSNLTTPPG